MRFGYADPPYLGQGKRHYGKHHEQAADWDDPAAHEGLIGRLIEEFPDGWAVSMSVPSLKQYLAWCPDDVRIAAWVKPFAVFKPNVPRAYCWEPVIFRGGRDLTREDATVRDWVSASITLRKGLTGAKPREFCYWLFDFLGVVPGDELVDLFPGTGIVGRCFSEYTTANVDRQLELMHG